MPIEGIRICGAKCRTKGGAPCEQPGMKNGRCRMHGGCCYKRQTHGRTTLLAKKERKKERSFLKEMKCFSADLKT
jgi:hypothetical protein